MKLSDYVIKFIEDLGVKHVFTLSGGGCIHLIDSLGKSEKIQYVCNLHEQGAGIAAEAYGQYTNNIGVAIVTTGPGGTNIMTPLAGAYLDSTPMLVIAGQVQTKDSAKQYGVRQLGFQEVDVVSMAKPVTKWAVTVENPTFIRWALEHAVELATTERPGPVLIEIPLDIQSKEIDPDNLIRPLVGSKDDPILISTVNKISEKFEQSKRPIVLAGNGIRLSDSFDLLDQFIRKHNLPVLTTWKAADFFDENDPLFVGRPGAIAPRGANFNQQNSDFILCLGARLDHGQLAYQAKYFAPNAYKVICDIDPYECTKLQNHMDLMVSCNVKDLLKELIKIPPRKDTGDWLKRCKDTYNRYPVCNSDKWKNGKLVNLYDFIHELSKRAPENALIVPGSSGACSEVVYQAWKVKKGQRLLNTPGLGSMGFGIGAAIGACLASGKKPTICIEGDGGWMMNIQELEVIRRLNLPITFFVLNNNGYGSIRSTQDGYFNGKYVASSPSSGVTLPSIQSIAMAFYLTYSFVGNHSDLLSKLDILLSIGHGESVVCEIMCDPDHKTLPKATVFQNDKGEFETAPMQFMKPPLDPKEQEENTIQ